MSVCLVSVDVLGQLAMKLVHWQSKTKYDNNLFVCKLLLKPLATFFGKFGRCLFVCCSKFECFLLLHC